METVFVSHSRGALQLVPLVKYNEIYKPPSPHRSEFTFDVNAAAKRPLQHNKRGNKQEQGESEAFVHGKK
jgi:hypothetical protein